MSFKGFITRDEWRARSPRSRSFNIKPIGQLTHWMGNRVGHITHDGCFDYVRAIQKFHMDGRGWADIAYTLMPCRHGYIFAGRGKGVRTAANGTNTANYRYHANALLIGQGDSPTQDLIDAHWAGYEMLGGGEHKGHRDFRSTSCPGDWAYDMARKGPQGTIITKPTPAPTEPTWPTSPEEDEMLKKGDEGDGVKAYQRRLTQWAEQSGRTKGKKPNAKGDLWEKFLHYGADGDYGSTTEGVVKEFQKAYDLDVTGRIGGVTAGILAMFAVNSGGGGSSTPHAHSVTGSLDVVGSSALGKELAKHLDLSGKLSTGSAG